MTNISIAFFLSASSKLVFQILIFYSIAIKLIQNILPHLSPYSLKIITKQMQNQIPLMQIIGDRGLIYYQVKRKPLDMIF